MSIKQSNDIKKQLRAITNLSRSVPKIIGIVAVNSYKRNFRRHGFIDATLKRWKKRQANNKRSRKSRAILVKTSRLKKSIRIVHLSRYGVTIGTDVPYAEMHNEGFNGTVSVKAHKRGSFSKKKEGTGVFNVKSKRERKRTVRTKTSEHTVKAHSKKMNIPKRQFIGDSKSINIQIDRILTRKIKQILG